MYVSTLLLIVLTIVLAIGVVGVIIIMYRLNETVHNDTKLELMAVEQTKMISEKPMKITYKY